MGIITEKPRLLFMNSPKIWALLSTVVTLLLGVTALVLADFGAPVWVFIFLTCLLCTVGLPTTLAVLLTASFWGKVPGLSGLGSFAVCATLLSVGFQTVFFLLMARFYRRGHGRAT